MNEYKEESGMCGDGKSFSLGELIIWIWNQHKNKNAIQQTQQFYHFWLLLLLLLIPPSQLPKDFFCKFCI